MPTLWKGFAPIFLILIAFAFIEGGVTADYADARSKMGGKSFKSSPSKTPASTTPGTPAAKGGFSRGLMGGLLGGALGGMLFGSMFGAGGSGMGILPLIILGGAAFFLYRRFAKSRQYVGKMATNHYAMQGSQTSTIYGGGTHTTTQPPPTLIYR